jgi:hypothetical protein
MAVGPFARGVSRTIAIALESTEGVQSTAQAQFLRRVTMDINQNTQAVESQEIRPSQQMADARQGTRSVTGTLSGQLSPASYKLLFQQIFRAAFVAGVSSAGLADTVATLDPAGTGNLIITGPSEHFVTVTGFKLGDVVRLANLTGGPAGDNGENLRIIALTDTVMTLAPPPNTPVLWASGQSVTISVVGKKLIVPITAQTDQSFTIEAWYGDVGQSEIFVGCKATQVSFNIPANGFVTFQMQFTGLQCTTGTTQQYPSATAASGTTSLTSTGGKVLYQGLPQSIITGINIQIVADAQAPPVVGSYYASNVFIGMLAVRGSLTCLMVNDTLTADFLQENEVQISTLLTTSPLPGADFVSLWLPRVKLMSGTKTDSQTSITRSYNLTALEQVNGGTGTNVDDTTVVMQDSMA